MRSLLLVLLAAASGCAATLANQTVGHVGCQESEITTANVKHSGPLGSTTTWEATCQGKTYICAKHPSGGADNTAYETSCSEKVAAQPAVPTPAPTPVQ